MTGPRALEAVVEGHPVLICQGCRFAWEPTGPDWTGEHLQALSNGCPECGDWLYLGEIAPPDPTPRSADA
ncbi:hypothetical protein GCM10017691_02950 [Pseudonocardia petroleophila]|uniref:Uncharacterized protein n=1 Tax=Pseudonocardia petroleophila TaxID=37331 RepID=A0A7G7MKX4_9PSEU|nr:hypothetical protein [Pseudonocardia petroleophila]QNG53435.1 hypothetical protein H6H00_05500 [Pseudonocardia petroleophila]